MAAATLSKELSSFLIEFSIGVHRHAMYPPDHPSLAPAAENIITRLAGLLAERRTLNIGVAHRQLIIEGVGTDQKHPVLTDLARRLHAHQLGAVSIRMGTRLREVEALLQVLADEPEPEDEPIGLLPPDQRPTWDHITLFPVGYDQLELQAGEGAEQEPRVMQLWLSMAQAAMRGDAPLDVESAPNGRTLADTIRAHAQEEGYDQQIVEHMLRLASELKDDESGDAAMVRQRLSELFKELDHATVGRLVEMGGDAGKRRKFLLDANRSLAVDSVFKVIQAAAGTSGQNISTSMTRMLSKLAIHAELGTTRVRAEADTALREHVEELMDDWQLEDPNPDEYTLVLDALSRVAPEQAPGKGLEEEKANLALDGQGAIRLIQMALEVDAFGPTVEAALIQVVNLGLISTVLPLLDQAPPDQRVARLIREHLTTPEQLARMLSGEDVDEEALRQLVTQVGKGALEPMFEALSESESRKVRRKVFDVLSGLGPPVWPLAAERVLDSRWYVQRNMLALLHHANPLPEGLPLRELLAHENPQVRREAFPLALAAPAFRDRALAGALADDDERMVRMALLELEDRVPETLVPTVINRVLLGDGMTDLRSLAVRVIGSSDSPLAFDAIMAICVHGRTFMGKPKLADNSPELLAGLRVLKVRWPDNPKVVALIHRALQSKDPAIRRAASVEPTA